MSLVQIICTFCQKPEIYQVGEVNPEHKIRLLIYSNPPKDLYFCNEQCLYRYLKKDLERSKSIFREELNLYEKDGVIKLLPAKNKKHKT